MAEHNIGKIVEVTTNSGKKFSGWYVSVSSKEVVLQQFKIAGGEIRRFQMLCIKNYDIH